MTNRFLDAHARVRSPRIPGQGRKRGGRDGSPPRQPGRISQSPGKKAEPRQGTKMRGQLQAAYDQRGNSQARLFHTFSPKAGTDVVFTGFIPFLHFLLCEGDPDLLQIDYTPARHLSDAGVMAIGLTRQRELQLRVYRTPESKASTATQLLDEVIERHARQRRLDAQARNLNFDDVRVLEFHRGNLPLSNDHVRLRNWYALVPWLAQARFHGLAEFHNGLASRLNSGQQLSFRDVLAMGGADFGKGALYAAAAVSGAADGSWQSDLNEKAVGPESRFWAMRSAS